MYTNPHGYSFSNLGKVREFCPHYIRILPCYIRIHTCRHTFHICRVSFCPTICKTMIRRPVALTSARPRKQPSRWTSMVLVRPAGCMDGFFHLWELVFLPLQLTLLPEICHAIYLRCDVVLRILL